MSKRMNAASPAKMWQWVDLNHRPTAYESAALPLSYTAVGTILARMAAFHSG